MIVVSNTSPLINLAAIGQFDLLRQLYTDLHIAAAVWQEIDVGDSSWPGRNEVAQAEWIEQNEVQNRSLVRALQKDLDRGEAETIALALELNADLVLLDERAGRRAASRQGLRVVGVVGILLAAKAQGLIDQVQPQLDALRQVAGFYLSDSLYERVLQLASENGEIA